MRGVNKAVIVGTLGQDPEVRYSANGAAICNLSVATNEEWKDKQTGEKQSRTEWHRIVIFGKLAEIAEKYLTIGSQAYFEGRIQTRKWQDSNGNDRYSTEIVANEMQMLGGRSDTHNAPTEQPKDYPQKGSDSTQTGGGGMDDIPFNQINAKLP